MHDEIVGVDAVVDGVGNGDGARVDGQLSFHLDGMFNESRHRQRAVRVSDVVADLNMPAVNASKIAKLIQNTVLVAAQKSNKPKTDVPGKTSEMIDMLIAGADRCIRL